jgi:hypothetical protein
MCPVIGAIDREGGGGQALLGGFFGLLGGETPESIVRDMALIICKS